MFENFTGELRQTNNTRTAHELVNSCWTIVPGTGITSDRGQLSAGADPGLSGQANPPVTITM